MTAYFHVEVRGVKDYGDFCESSRAPAAEGWEPDFWSVYAGDNRIPGTFCQADFATREEAETYAATLRDPS